MSSRRASPSSAEGHDATSSGLVLRLVVSAFACFTRSFLHIRTDRRRIAAVRAGFEARRDAWLANYLETPIYQMDDSSEGCRTGLKAASWIWIPNEDARRQAAIGVRHFRREFSIASADNVRRAIAAFAADNYADIFVNGHAIGRANGFTTAERRDITPHLVTGTNTIVVTVHNAGTIPNPAGVLGTVCIRTDKDTRTILTDATWQASESTDDEPASNSAWQPVNVLGPSGCGPWGMVRLRLETEVNRYVFSRLTFALAALHLNAQTDLVNARIIESVQQIRREHQAGGEFGLHWMGGVFYRVYGLFGPGGQLGHRLSDEASNEVWMLFAEWARSDSLIAEADPERTWRIWGSENHSAQRDATRWAAARMIAADPRSSTFRYDDGSTADQQVTAWRKFLTRYFQERVKRGMLVEISPSGYGSRTMQGWHNIYDFTDDPKLKRFTKAALDVWWADWAQEQFEGMRGGGKTRLYPGAYTLSRSDRNRAMSWFYLGQGKPAHQHETLPVIATTTYRLPLVVMDVALDVSGRGIYEAKSRRLGRHLDYALSQSLSKPNEPVYEVDPNYGGLIRYTYCTPDFIIGSLMLESRPKEYWTAISQQNRWHGVIFPDAPDSTIYPRCETTRSTYNAHWALQNKGTLIAQKLRHADATGTMRVLFSSDLERTENGGWVFAKAKGAFAAVRIVHGDWRWDDECWLRCDREYTPVILEVARSTSYNDDFRSFQNAVLRQVIKLKDGVLRYRGLQDGAGDFTFYTTSDRLPELNGQPINLRPDYAFESPFLEEAWASGVVRIHKDNRELLIDVRE